jgi:hypothetical protein
MDIPTYFNNLDYEYALFHPHYQNGQFDFIIRRFEYVFFFLQRSPAYLYALGHYSTAYLHYLKQLGFLQHITIQHQTSSKKRPPHLLYWWGQLQDPEKERGLNSKLTSVKLSELLKLNAPQRYIAHHLKDLHRPLPTSGDWLIKNPYLMSGRGHFSLEKIRSLSQENLPLLNGMNFFPCIVEQKVSILIELGLFHYSQLQRYLYINLVDAHGHYKGCLYTPSPADFLPIIPTLHKGLLELQQQLETIITHLYHSEQVSHDALFNIDSLIYQEEEQHCLYPLMEMNYRRSMGMIPWTLHKKSFTYTLWKMYPKKSKNYVYTKESDQQLLYDYFLQQNISDRPHFILLSPLEAEHISIVFFFNYYEEFVLLEKQLFEKIFTHLLPH